MRNIFRKKSDFKEDADHVSVVFGTMRAAKKRLSKEMGMELLTTQAQKKALQRKINKMIQERDPTIMQLDMFKKDPELFEKMFNEN